MNNIRDIVFDKMLKEAVLANFQERMETMPLEEDLRKEYVPSPEHVYKMKKLFVWEKRRDFMRKTLPVAKTAVMVLCVATAVFFSVLMFNPQVRASVRGAIVEFFELFIRVEFDPSENMNRVAGSFVLGYIPDGYEQTDFEEFGESSMTIYYNENGYILMFNVNAPGVNAVDNEHSDFRIETHDGIDYYIFESNSVDNYSNISWTQDGFMFVLNGMISVEELLKIAQSVY